MPASTDGKALFAPIPPFHPEKRARAIREAVKSGKIKQSGIINEILVLLDEIVEKDAKTA